MALRTGSAASGRRSTAKMLTKDEARRIAANVAEGAGLAARETIACYPVGGECTKNSGEGGLQPIATIHDAPIKVIANATIKDALAVLGIDAILPRSDPNVPFRDAMVKTQPLFAAGSTSPDGALSRFAPASHRCAATRESRRLS